MGSRSRGGSRGRGAPQPPRRQPEPRSPGRAQYLPQDGGRNGLYTGPETGTGAETARLNGAFREDGPPEPQPEPEPRRRTELPPTGGRAQRRRAARRAQRRRRLRATREVPILIFTALLIALLLKTFLVQAFSIPSGSMENTIRVGDRVVVDKLTPWFGSTPSRGDVVVFRDPGGWLDGQPPPKKDPPGISQVKTFFTFIGLLPSADEQDLIKRVVGVGGDTVACCDAQGRVTVNGHPLEEPYLRPGNPPSKIKFKVNVPRDRIFVMGDHRSNSADSRFHLDDGHGGTVPLSLVVGRAFYVAWPVGHWRGLEEPDTYASVPKQGAQAASGAADIRGKPGAPPVPMELPLVMSVVGMLPKSGRLLRTPRARPGRGPRSTTKHCAGRRSRGGPGGRRTIRIR